MNFHYMGDLRPPVAAAAQTKARTRSVPEKCAEKTVQGACRVSLTPACLNRGPSFQGLLPGAVQASAHRNVRRQFILAQRVRRLGGASQHQHRQRTAAQKRPKDPPSAITPRSDMVAIVALIISQSPGTKATYIGASHLTANKMVKK